MLNIYIAHENGTYFANPIVYKCVYVDGGGGGGSGGTGAAVAPWLCKRTHLQKCKNRSTTDIDRKDKAPKSLISSHAFST